MERPTIDNNHAVSQAGMTIGQYLIQAEEEIDKVFGKGYAAKHPDLVAACVTAQALDFNNTALTSAIYEIKDAIDDVASALSQ